jgi:hypothetical protein
LDFFCGPQIDVFYYGAIKSTQWFLTPQNLAGLFMDIHISIMGKTQSRLSVTVSSFLNKIQVGFLKRTFLCATIVYSIEGRLHCVIRHHT